MERVWSHHTYGPGKDKLVGPLLIKLIEKANTSQGKEVVLNSMHGCWIAEMEEPVAEILLGGEESESCELSAAYVLTNRKARPYLPTLLERARAVKSGGQNRWLEVLLETRVKRETGILKSVTELGFKQLEAERMQADRSLVAYGTARRLECYLDQIFVPQDIEPDDAHFFHKTVENALKWWQQNQ